MSFSSCALILGFDGLSCSSFELCLRVELCVASGARCTGRRWYDVAAGSGVFVFG